MRTIFVAVFVLIAAFVATDAGGEPAFRDVTAECGIDFVHSNGATGEKQYKEVMGSGVCLFDYDGDDRLDVYFVDGVGSNRLYRNLGELRFEDVTASARVGDEGYGMGAVAADVDNDGDTDLFVTNFGPNAFYENRGGVFTERASAAGLDDDRWGASASFLDFDRDGFLDLYVVDYVEMAEPDTNECRAAGGLRLYCPPRRYPRAHDVLYRNHGDGTFEDVSEAAGVAGVVGRGLGVIATDFDRDGWPDLYVANDLDPNFLFHNCGDGTFEEVGVFTGVSHSENGVEESGMGVAAGDYDNDGWIDLFVSNYVDETNTLYHNEAGMFFLDESAASRVGPTSLPYIGWGAELFDWDGDGFLDLLVVNGHTESDAEKVDPTTTWKQRDFLYRNRGDGSFLDVTEQAAPALLEKRSGRGAAFGDLDDDGDVDVVFSNQNDPPCVLENVGASTQWIGVKLIGESSNREGVGARVEVWAGDYYTVREAQAGGSYLSSNDPRLLFGLGERAVVDSVAVTWPSGARDVEPGLAAGRYHAWREGGGAE